MYDTISLVNTCYLREESIMQIYVALLEHKDCYIKKISTLKPSDELILFAGQKDASISLDLFNELQNAKCKVNIMQMPSFVEGHYGEYLAFYLGSLAAKNDVKILNLAPYDFIQDFISNTDSTPKKARKATVKESVAQQNPVKVSVDTEDSEKSFMNPPEATDAKPEKTASKSSRGRKPAVKSESPAKKEEKKTATEDEFDKVYGELESLVTSLSNDEIDLSTQIYNIVAAVKCMDEEKITLQNALQRSCSSFNAIKVFDAIKGKKKEITALIRKLPKD